MNSEQYKEAFAAILPDEELIQSTLDAAKRSKNHRSFRVAGGLAVAAVCLAAVLCIPWIPKAGRGVLDLESTMSPAQTDALDGPTAPSQTEEEVRTADATSQISDYAISEAPSHTVSYDVITPPASSRAQVSSAASDAYVPHVSALPGLQINELSGSVGAARLYFPPDDYDTATWSLEQFTEHWGRSILPSSLPEDLTESQPGHAGEVVLTKEGELAYDAYHFTFAESFDESYDPLRRQVTLSVSMLGMAKDAVYPLEHPIFSQLNGVEVMFGHCSMPYGPYDPETHAPAGESDVYVAEFTCGGIEHQLITENLTLGEAQKILLSLL